MVIWVSALSVFQGGSQQVVSLNGKRVRPTVRLGGYNVYDPIHNKQDKMDIESGTEGFVANPLGADLLIAFPTGELASSVNLNELTKGGNFKVVIVNIPSFKEYFEIERS